MTSLKERLRQRERPVLPYLLRIDDTAPAEAELERVRREHHVLVVQHEEGSPEYIASQKRLAAAEAALAACFEAILLRAMKSDEYEALRDLHPPTPEQEAAGEAWNPKTFPAPLLAETAEGDMTEEDWKVFLVDQMSKGEREGLFSAALTINEAMRAAEPGFLPKGWPAILS